MDKKQALQHTFDTVAKGYDHPALSFFPETAKRMVQYLLPAQPNSIQLLDVCTGTGVVASEAARINPNAQVTGIDLSQGMLAQAQSKADQQNLNNISFMQMDLDQLDFPDHHFDSATCSFGLFFLDDMQQGLRNIAAKVKPKGKLAISTFSEGSFEPMSILFLERYEAFGYEAPPLSWKQMTTDNQLTELFTDAGITSVDIHREPLGFHMTSANDWWNVVWNAGYRGLLNQMSEGELVNFKEQHLQEVQQLIDAGNTWLDTGVVIATGELS
jgi:ubiquinone/menaquinone biosynthesis C-methylase UbiE